ncbi:MAG: GEVED domain-containing protein [Ferruginibacter sp.]
MRQRSTLSRAYACTFCNKLLALLILLTAGQYAVSQTCDPTQLYDQIESSYHTTIAQKTDGSFAIFGERGMADGSNPALSARTITTANGYSYTGTILKVATGSGGNTPTQHFVLTTTRLYTWGEEDLVINTSLTSSEAFQAIAPAGSNAYGLPGTVAPTDVKYMQATFGAIAIMTNSGAVYVLGKSSSLYGDGTATANSVWHQVTLSTTGNPVLTGATHMRISPRGGMVVTSSNAWYTWGNLTSLGNGTAPAARTRATPMTLPAAFTAASDVRMIGVTSGVKASSSSSTAYYVLHSTQKLIYVMGENVDGNLGINSTTDQTSWVNVRNSTNTANLSDIVYMSVQESDEDQNSAAAIQGDGTLWEWGSNDGGMIGRPLATTIQLLPAVPQGFTQGTDRALTVEVGGHFTVYIKAGSQKYAYVGHNNDGSQGTGIDTDTYFDSYDTTNVSNINVCAMQVIDRTVTGTVFNDTDGLTDNQVDGTGTNGSGTLMVVVYDNTSGKVTDTAYVAANGTYTVLAPTGDDCTLYLTTTAATIGQTAVPTVTLPAGWISTGEYLGAGTGNDGTANSILPLGTVSVNTANANLGITAAGYIYIHKKTLDESSSTNFSFAVSGGSTVVPGFSLNDDPAQIPLQDIGTSEGGRLWAVSQSTATPASTLFYRNANSTAWVNTGIGSVSRVDGGQGNTCYYITTTGSVVYYDGSTSTTIGAAANYGTSSAADIGSTWDNRPYITTAAGRIYRYSGTGTTWAQIGATTNNSKIDGNPATGNIIVSKTDNLVYSITSAAVQTSLGSPASISGAAVDVAVDAVGGIYSIYMSPSVVGAEAAFKWTSGTTWSAGESTSKGIRNITGGAGGQMWATAFNLTAPYGNIFTRSLTGSTVWWLDDERVRTSVSNGNSIMIPVVPGTYTVTETVPGGWALQSITAYDPTSNSSSTLSAGTASLAIAAGETVHAIFNNGVVNAYTVPSNCGTIFTENFGTGATGTYGAALAGLTSYHYLGNSTNAEDGYYKIISRTSPDFRSSGSSAMFDHTAGDGTGRMLVVNASYEQNEFYRKRLTGLVPGSTYILATWLAGVSGVSVKPNLTLSAVEPTTYASVGGGASTGDITSLATWGQYATTFVPTSTSVDIILQNTGTGGVGNDIAIDDIYVMVPNSNGGTANSSQTIAYNATPGSLIVSAYLGTVLRWQYSSDNFVSDINDIASSASATLTSAKMGALTANRYYRAVVQNGTCAEAYSSSVLITITASISGNVLNDTDGLSDNTISGTGTNAGGTLYVNAVNGSNAVIASTAVAAGGTYTLSGLPLGTYTLVLTTSATSNTAALPAGWINTGEYLGAGSGSDGTINGALTVTVSANTSNARFGATPAAYIYVHEKALDESSSVDFTFNVTGGVTTVPSFSLNDNPAQSMLQDIGASQGGRLWAVSATAASPASTLFYRSMSNAAWVNTGITGVSKVDGAAGNACYYITTTGSVVYYDGTTSTTIGAAANYGSSNASDIGSTWDNQPYITTAAGRIYRYSGTGTTWAQIGATTNNQRIDGNPATGNIIVSKSDGNIYNITSAGVQTSLGKPANVTATTAADVATDAAGNIFTAYDDKSGVGGANGLYTNKWISGTSWSTPELTSRTGLVTAFGGLTGSIGNQLWVVNNGSAVPYGNIFTRSTDGSAIWWIDDERVHTSPTNGNSQMIAVVPGAYTVTQTVPAGWDLQEIQLYDPTSNSSSDVVNNNAVLTAAAGEVVHAIFNTGMVNAYTVATNCGTPYTESFGTGTVGSFGTALTGQTSYHFLSGAGDSEDGYYKVVGRTNPDFRSTSASLFDHTSGNGTGRMMVINAAYDQNVFYRRQFTGLITGSTYTFAAWLINVSSAAIKPNVTFKIIDPSNYTVLSTNNTGDITTTGTWAQYSITFVATGTTADIVLQNNNVGGSGNDLGIDDITLSVASSVGGTASAAQSIAYNTSPANLTATGITGAVTKWQYSSDNFVSDINDIASSASSTLTSAQMGALTATRYYRAVVQNGSCATANSSSVLISITSFNVSGSVWVDANGDGSKASETNYTGGSLYANLVDNSGNITAKATVDAAGNYTLSGFPISTTGYSVRLSTNSATIGQPSTTLNLYVPSGYVRVSENNNGTAETGTSADGIISLPSATTNLTTRDFGIMLVCNGGTIFTYSGTGEIRPFIDPSTSGALGPVFNPTSYSATTTGYAMGYNPVNGKFYCYHKSTVPKTFLSFDPATNTYVSLPTAGNNLYRGCVNQTGTGFYTIDDLGVLYYYNIATNTWTTITSTWLNQYGTNITSQVVSEGSGDMVIDGSGNLWVLAPYGANSFHLYKIAAPLPTTAVSNLTVRIITGATLSTSLGGIALSAAGEIYLAGGSPSILYKINSDYSVATIGALSVSGSGDLSSCSFPATVITPMEFGDAPNSYSTLLASNGARHAIVDYDADTKKAKLMLGASLDPEMNGVPAAAGADATGDDLAGVDDEEAIATFPVLSTTSTTYSVILNVTNTTGVTATVKGWIDFNKNNVFDAGEAATTTVANNGTTATLSWTGLSGLAVGNTYARFRIATTAAEIANPTGAASDGEVEDYRIAVSATVSGTISQDANGITDNMVNGSGVTVSGLNVVLYDNTTGKVIATSPVAPGGAYTLNGAVPGNNYSVYLTTATVTVGQTAVPALTLPSGWAYVGEYNGAGAGDDGTPNGILSLGAVSGNITTAKFGIEQQPTANTVNAASQQNPGGNAQVTVPTLTGTDTEDGPYDGVSGTTTIVIQTVPSNATLYYGGSAVTAGTLINGYDPSSLTLDPNNSITSAVFTYTVMDEAGQFSSPATVTMPFTTAVPFSCTNLAYQVAGTAGSNSSLYSYNINTGDRLLIANLPVEVNSIGYNTTDNMIWGYDETNDRMIRIDANGAITSFNIANFPNSVRSMADILPGGYYITTNPGGTRYFTLDVNPAHTNYLKLVDPTNGYAVINSAPYYKDITGGVFSALDFAFNPTDNKLYGADGSTSQLQVLNPATGAFTLSAAVTGLPTGGKGAVFFDNTNNLYAFANTTGNFYKINISSNTASLLSTSVPANNNDGASCLTAVLSYTVAGTVSQDANGLTDNNINGTATNAGGVNVILYDNSTAKVAAVAAVAADGTYSLAATPGDNFSIYLTTATATVGQSTVPALTLPSGWGYTGEKNSAGTGSDGTADGILSLGVVNANNSNTKFGIENLPVANAVTATTCGTSSVTLPTLNGTDTEDGSIGSGGSIVIVALPSNGTLKYNNVNATAGQNITSYNPALLTLVPNAGGTTVSFTYNVKDAAGKTAATAATVTVTVNGSGQWVGGASGDWNVAANWCGGIPTLSTNVIIPTGSVVYIQSADASAKTLTVNTGGSLVMTGVQYLNIADGGGITNNGSFDATASTGMVSFAGAGTVSGTITFKDIRTFGALDFGTASTITGNFYLYTNGTVTGHSPTYTCPSATLQYRTGTTFVRGLEWVNGTSGAGYPANVRIGANTVVNFPANGNGYVCNDIIIENGSSLRQDYSGGSAALHIGRHATISGTLSLGASTGGDMYVGGNWNRTANGVFNHNDRKVVFDGPSNFSGNGTSMSTITAPASSAKDNEGGFGGEKFAHLWISKTNTTDSVVLLSNITVTREIGFTSGTFSLRNRDVTLVSNSSRTADVAPITNTSNVNIRYAGTGKFVVQRYVPNPTGTRSWRLLTAPVQAATAPTISEAWQEGVSNPDKTSPNANSNAYNPWPGYGTHITGPAGTYDAANGFDQGTNSASILYASPSGWLSPASTTSTKVTDQQAWMLFVRGDRSFVIGGQYVPSQNTILEPKGRINVGNVTVHANAGKIVMGNPYASAISLLNIDVAGSAGKNNTYYQWDPKMFTSYTQPGKWVTFTGIGNSFVQTTSESNYASDGTVESGQAFVLDMPAAGNVIFHESDKKALSSSLIGLSSGTAARPGSNQYGLFRSDIYAGNEGKFTLTDGVLNIYNSAYDNKADAADAKKLINFNTKESLSILRDSMKIAIEKRMDITTADTIFFTMSKFNELPYQFKFDASGFNTGMQAWLEDNYTGKRTELSTMGASVVDFNITSDAASKAADRFRVVFKNPNGFTLPVSFTNVKAWPKNNNVAVQWNVENELNIQQYEIERSADGQHFTKAGVTTATGSNTYNWVDESATSGYNYYRIVSRETNGKIQYSQVVKVNMGAVKGNISVYPNPVTDGIIKLKFSNMEQGDYSVKLLNTLGQTIITAEVNNSSNNTLKEINVQGKIAKGIYHLEINKNDMEKTTVNVIVE